MQLSTYRLLVGISLSLFGGIAWYCSSLFDRMNSSVGTAIHAQQTRMELIRLISAIKDVESGSRGYVLTGQTSFLGSFEAGMLDVAESARKLSALKTNNPSAVVPMDTLIPLVKQKTDYSQRLVNLRTNSGFEQASKEFASGRAYEMMEAVRSEAKSLDGEQMEQIIERGKADERSTVLSRLILFAGSILSLLSLTTALVMLMRENKLRNQAERQLHQINENLEQRVAERAAELESASEALQENSERLRLAVEASNVGLWDWNIVTNRVTFSHEWKGQLGYEDHEIGDDVGEWAKFVHPDDQLVVRAETKRYIFRGSGPLNQEFRMLHRDGTWHWIFSRGEVYRDEGGKPVRMLGCHLDITDHKLAEVAHRESEERFQAFMDQSPVVAWTKDNNFEYVYANAAFEVLFDRPVQEILGCTDYDIIPKEHADVTRSNDTWVAETGNTLETTEAVPGADGKLRQWLVQKFPLNRTGQPTWVGGTAVDITDRVAAEEALIESEGHFRILVDAAPEAIVLVIFETGTIVDANKNAAKLFECTVEQLRGLTPIGLSPKFQPDGRLSEDAARDRILESVENGHAEFEWTHCTLNGRQIPCEVRLVRLEVRGQIWLRGSIIDITERKLAAAALQQSESALRAFMDALPTPAMLLDADGTFIVVNDALAQSFGRSREELIGQIAYPLLPPDIASKRKAFVDDVFVNGREVIFEDSNLDRHYINYLSPVLDSKGTVCNIAVFALEITDRKRVEEKLELQLDELRRWHLATIDREDRALELKHEINQLLQAAGQPARYPSAERAPIEKQP
jgi:PAS domain S-box-containing protein